MIPFGSGGQAGAGPNPRGAEGKSSVLFGSGDGRSATRAGAFTAYGPGRMMLTGTRGWIDVHPRFHRAASVTIWRERTPEHLEFESGYRYEIEHVGECLAAGLTESPVMPLDDTVAVQRIMAEVLAQL